MIEIRPIEDIFIAIQFLKRYLNVFNKDYPRTIEYVVNIYRKYSEFFLGAYCNKKLVGALFSYPNFSKGELLIGELAVAEEFRNKGIGAMLIKNIINIAKKYRIKKVYGGIKAGVENFYIKLGFKIKLFVQSKSKIKLKYNFLRLEKVWYKNGIYYYIFDIKRILPLEQLLKSLNNILAAQYIFEKELNP